MRAGPADGGSGKKKEPLRGKSGKNTRGGGLIHLIETARQLGLDERQYLQWRQRSGAGQARHTPTPHQMRSGGRSRSSRGQTWTLARVARRPEQTAAPACWRRCRLMARSAPPSARAPSYLAVAVNGDGG